MNSRSLTSVIGALAVTATAAGLGPVAGAAQSTGAELFPDLDQQTPNQLLVARSGYGWRLGFQSAVRNIGTGPLLIEGHRPNRRTPFMTGDQRVLRQDAPSALYMHVGRLRYVRSVGHEHWHFLHFERYELRRAGSNRLLVRDRKTGFCLGDRYRVIGRVVPGAPPQAVHTGRCALRHPERLKVSEGISVGYGDNYLAYLEGQSLPIGGLRAGHYVLVHRVNIEHGIRESDYTNNASSVLLDLSWRHARPHIELLASCPDSDRCDTPQGPAVASARRLPVRTRAPLGRVRSAWLCPLLGRSGSATAKQ